MKMRSNVSIFMYNVVSVVLIYFTITKKKHVKNACSLWGMLCCTYMLASGKGPLKLKGE